MNNNIIDSIEKLKPYTNTSLIEMQKANIPSYYHMELDRRFSFDIHGVYHSMYREDCLLLISNHIPFAINQKRHVYADTLDKLVESDEVLPFLLFFNGAFIKWSDITIIKDCKYSYILINNVDIDEKYDIQTIIIPKSVKYEESSNIINMNTIFIFDEDGKSVNVTELGKQYTIISKLNSDDFYYTNGSINNNTIAKVDLPDKLKLHKENIITFKDGLLYNSEISLEGLNFFRIDKEMTKIYDIEYKVFYDLKCNESKDNLFTIRNKEYIELYIDKNKSIPQYVKDLNKGFDFLYNRNRTYEENVFTSLKNIMSYNTSLLNDVYKSKSNIVSKIYKGKDIIPLIDNNGLYKFSKKIGDEFNNEVIIFVNGELHKNYNELKNRYTHYIIPMGDIQNEDVIEFLFFKNIEYDIVPIIFRSVGNDIHYINHEINMDNMKLFAMDIYDKEFMIESKDTVQYEIEYVHERISETEYKIYPKDSYYYDKRLTLVSKRQFLYSFTKIKDDNTYDIQLPDNFRYCNNLSQFIVFVNGRKIDHKNFKITIAKKTRPFDDLSVYINIELNKNDRLEVFYVPEELEEVVTEPMMNLKGKLVIDQSKLLYNFSKDLYLVFVNGKKINTNQLQNIDSNKIMVLDNIKTVHNLTIIKYIKDDELLSEIFKQNKDLITHIMDSINSNDLSNLYGKEAIVDEEIDIVHGQVPMKSIMYKLIKDYWMRPYINNGDNFLYDFDDEEFLENDSDGNTIIRVLDANEENRVR